MFVLAGKKCPHFWVYWLPSIVSTGNSTWHCYYLAPPHFLTISAHESTTRFFGRSVQYRYSVFMHTGTSYVVSRLKIRLFWLSLAKAFTGSFAYVFFSHSLLLCRSSRGRRNLACWAWAPSCLSMKQLLSGSCPHKFVARFLSMRQFLRFKYSSLQKLFACCQRQLSAVINFPKASYWWNFFKTPF